VNVEPRTLSRGERLRVVGLASAVSLGLLLFFSPAWVAFRAWSRVSEVFWLVVPVRRGLQVMKQVAEPFAEITDPLHAIVRWRLLMPLAGYVLHLSPWVVLALAPLGCVLVLATLIGFARQRELSWSECTAFAIVAGASAWFFTSTGWLGYYDSWVVLGLLAVAWARCRWLLWSACFFTLWVDERFVLGFPLALFVRWVASSATPRLRELGPWLLRQAPALALVGLCVVLRLVLAGRYGSDSLVGYKAKVEILEVSAGRIALGLWEGLRFAWIPVLFASAAWFRRGSRAAGLLLGFGTMLTALVALATNNDLSRSAALALPVLPLGWMALREHGAWLRWRTPSALALLALLIPARHVVSTFTVPIHGLVAELQALDHPPPPYAPELYVEEAERLAKSGDRPRAREQATIALRLAGRDTPEGARAAEFLRELKEGAR
jgi:hypothetical protein